MTHIYDDSVSAATAAGLWSSNQENQVMREIVLYQLTLMTHNDVSLQEFRNCIVFLCKSQDFIHF